MSHHLVLIGVFLVLALIIPLIMFLRVFRAVFNNIDSDAQARDEAEAAKSGTDQHSAEGKADA
jgi:hypothetical protein